MLFLGQTPNSAVKESLLPQTGCLHYSRYDIFTFFGIWVNLYYYLNIYSLHIKKMWRLYLIQV